MLDTFFLGGERAMQSKIAMVASLGLLMGCARQTVVVPPESLPAFAESQTVVYARTRDGKPVIEQGPIRAVVVHSWPPAATHEEATRVEGFSSPFRATLAGDQLQVSDDEGKAAHALRDIQQIDVSFDARVGGSPPSAMRIAGIVLTSLGSAFLVTGFGLLFGVTDHRGSAPVFFASVPAFALSPLLAGIGIPLWVAGGPAGVPSTTPLLAPKVYATALRWAF
jgi:hypothetical protein